jgi:hypothetical protein
MENATMAPMTTYTNANNMLIVVTSIVDFLSIPALFTPVYKSMPYRHPVAGILVVFNIFDELPLVLAEK